jgi:hypothetical protein
MLGSKLYLLLSSLSQAQLNSFHRFIHSPYFNENEVIIAFGDHLVTQLGKPAHDAEQLNKKVVWRFLYENKPYHDAQFRSLSTSMLSLLYKFLHIEACDQNPLSEKLAVMGQLKAPEMEKHFKGLTRQFNRLKEEQPAEGAEQFHQLYLFHYLQHKQIEERGEKQADFQSLETADNYLDAYYHLEKLKHYCDALGYQSFLSHQPRINLPGGFKRFLEESEFLAFPLIKAYYLVARLLESPEEEGLFVQLKDLLFNYHAQFVKDDQLALFIHLTNYCIHKKINIGRSDFYPALFEVYQKAIETGVLLQNGYLQPQDYKNIITVGLLVKAFKWVENFTREYAQLLPEENQENAVTYNLAKVYFYQQEYEKVIEKLREVEYEDRVYALGSKLMLLRTYYELGEFIALDSLIDSFRIYLRRDQKISRDVKQQYMNVLRFVKKLSKVMPRDREALQKIRLQVEKCNALAAKNWILEKIEELGGGVKASSL